MKKCEYAALICLLLFFYLIVYFFVGVEYSELGKEFPDKDVAQDTVRAPLPVKRDVLYDNMAHYGYITLYFVYDTHVIFLCNSLKQL